MGFENITANDGFAIASTGMLIVFAALTFISLFIYCLPGALRLLGVPDEPEKPQQRPSDDEELIAAIGYALHQSELQKNQPT
jgi:Na+-transporting methylmalonyl-CoA/oxaloacetate decarboxylase gamma subunit